MNALCLKAPDDKKQRFEQNLSSREIRTVINEKVIRNPKIGTEMSHQLYVFQQLTFNLLERKCMTAVDPSSTDAQETILELRSNAFENAPEIQKRHGQHMYTEDYKKLGFTNFSNPLLDFGDTPPGLLALDCMSHFANNHSDIYYQVVHENFSRGIEHECPFAKTSIAVTKLLCEILKVGEIPGETGQGYHPMFFSVDKSFEEFFCWCIRLFSKTWKEMRATKEDFPKVLSVVKEQIELSLRKRPPTLDQFWNILINDLTYTKIVELRQQERWNKEEWTSKASPVLALREQITPEIQELIKQQRLNYLVEGTRFNKVTKTGRLQDKYWYCRLSTNHKTLHSGDIQDGDVPSVDSLSNKRNKVEGAYAVLSNKKPLFCDVIQGFYLSVSDIVQIQTGKECSFVKRSAESLAFTVLAANDQKLDFLAASQDVYDMWIDGLNVLLGSPMPSKQASTDLDTLLGMEMSIRLLDTANIPIPEEAPPVPPPPSDYNFYYDN